MMWRTPPEPETTSARAGAQARRSARIRDRRRQRLVAALRSVARQAGTHATPRRGDLLLRDRAAGVRPQLLELAAALERVAEPPSETLRTVRWLLTDGCTSPLWNPDVPAAVLGPALDQLCAELSWAEAEGDVAPVIALPTAPRPGRGRGAGRRRAKSTPRGG